MLIETDRVDKNKMVPIGYDEFLPPFLSTTTNHGLRVTIQSFIDVIEMLLFKYNFKYVLTGKFNQDCLEVGKERMFRCYYYLI